MDILKDLLIERAKEEDVPRILEIMQTANMHNVPSPEMPKLDWRCFFTAKIEGKIVGVAGYSILSLTEAKTTLMAVHPDYKRMGIGKLLQNARMRALTDMGIKILITNADIPSTIEWYKKHFGYKKVGQLKKIHEFGDPNINYWTTLEVDLCKWYEDRKEKL